MNFFRWMFGVPVAALVTAGLFLAMAGLIKRETPPGDPTPTPKIDIFAKIPPDGPLPKPPRPTKVDPPPLPDTRDHMKQGPVDPIAIPKPTNGEGPPPIDGRGTFKMPVIKPAPIYPEACRARGAQGNVTVMYDVTDRGEVVNVRVVSSEDHCLDGAAKQAVSRWKYPPGRQFGLVQTFTFQLEN